MKKHLRHKAAFPIVIIIPLVIALSQIKDVKLRNQANVSERVFLPKKEFKGGHLDMDRIIEGLKRIETKDYDTFAVGDSGRAVGILQLHKCYVDEVNEALGFEFEYSDRTNAETSERITRYYLCIGIKRYLRETGEYPSEKRVVQFHNFGMYKKPYDNGYYELFKESLK